MTTPNPDTATRARQLLDAATPGPWEMSEVEATAPHWLTDVFVTDADLGEPVAQILVLDHPDYEVWQPRADANAELIAAAPGIIADLLADHDRLADENRALREQLEEAQLRSIEARNPGIDMDEVRASRAAAADRGVTDGDRNEGDEE